MIADISPPTSADCTGLGSQGPFYTVTPVDTLVAVTWIEPTWSDDSGVLPTITKSPDHSIGDILSIGSVTITYTATDGSSNTNICIVSLDIQGEQYLKHKREFNNIWPHLYIIYFNHFSDC